MKARWSENLKKSPTQNPHKETPSKQVIASCRRDKNCCSCLRKLSIFIRRSSTQQHTTEYAICSSKKKCKFHYETVTNTKIAMKFRKNIKIKISPMFQLKGYERDDWHQTELPEYQQSAHTKSEPSLVYGVLGLSWQIRQVKVHHDQDQGIILPRNQKQTHKFSGVVSRSLRNTFLKEISSETFWQ